MKFISCSLKSNQPASLGGQPFPVIQGLKLPKVLPSSILGFQCHPDHRPPNRKKKKENRESHRRILWDRYESGIYYSYLHIIGNTSVRWPHSAVENAGGNSLFGHPQGKRIKWVNRQSLCSMGNHLTKSKM